MTIEQRLIAKCGLTNDFYLSLWMLKNGQLVNGSYEGHQRDIDHHEIGEFFKPSKRQTPGSSYIYIRKFMNRGNIRMGCSPCGCCVEFTKIPTQEQFNMLQRLANFAYDNGLPIQFTRHSNARGTIRESTKAFVWYTQQYTHLKITCLYPELAY